jgi:hypothetical protein
MASPHCIAISAMIEGLGGMIMAYRMSVLLALTLFACGDDGGSNNSTKDAPTATDDSSGGSGSDDGGGTVDAPPGMTADAGVGATCGSMTCSATQECCVGQGGSTCVAAGTCNGVSFACDGPEDCASNQVCCFGNGGGGSGATEGSECKPAQQCQANACHVDTDCSGQTSKCCAIGNTQYKVCLAQCPMM